jgi:nifR3 family TIM-barrel protein
MKAVMGTETPSAPRLRYEAGPGGTPLVFDPPLILAPMAGITDRYFRRILREVGGVGLVTMEFVSSEGLHRGNRRTRKLLEFDPAERPLAIQIYGSRPEPMAEAARLVEELGADACDINMGCPANKVLKGCAGAALMGDLRTAEAIIAAVRAATSLPLTVKFRAGIRESELNYLELGRICQDQGAAAVALHPRTAKQFYRGSADWKRIARLKEELRIPVIGNGDVTRPEDVLEMMRRTGCDAVMIGRASMKNPWIFRQARDLLAGREYDEPTPAQRRDLIVGHFRMLQEREDETHALHKIRTFAGWYTHGLPGGRELRRRISSFRTTAEFLDAVEEFFSRRCAA